MSGKRITATATCAILLSLAVGVPGIIAPPIQTREGAPLSPPTAHSGKGTPLFISPSTLRVLEQQLNQNGYDAGDVDGIWDPRIEQALTSFQRSHGLEPTGNVNLETLQALGIPPAARPSTGRPPISDTAALVGAPISISPANLRKIEQKLSEKGHDPGKIDGRWDADLGKAIRGFERVKGLEPTGTINLAMLKSLGLDQLLAGLAHQEQQQAGGDREQRSRAYYGDGREKEKQSRPGTQTPGEMSKPAAISGISGGTGAPLYISPAGVRRVQKSLGKAGYDPNGVDGVWGKGTTNAVRDWQQANGLEPTGNLNIQTAEKLGVLSF